MGAGGLRSTFNLFAQGRVHYVGIRVSNRHRKYVSFSTGRRRTVDVYGIKDGTRYRSEHPPLIEFGLTSDYTMTYIRTLSVPLLH